MSEAIEVTAHRDNTHNAPAHEAELLWQAVLARDASYDGRLFFGVRSTGIYCRPTCPARRPRREQVVFFQIPEAAESAGFRSCLRCKPRERVKTDPQVEMVRRACAYIETHLESSPTLEDLSVAIGISPYHLQRVFKRVAGISPRQYAEAFRLSRFKSGVKHGRSVTEAMYGAGYGSSSRLYEHAPSRLGMTPAAYRRGGKGTRITYAIAECSLGSLLVAATEKGVCSVRLGDSRREMEGELRNEYPAADIKRDDAALHKWVEQLLNHLAGKLPHVDLPLDVKATAFQWKVWENLREIPYGTTKSYGEVARAIGRPTATRAVARACATNPVALVIPCHRVIREDKSLGGYRWGLDRKKKILANEKDSKG